MTFSQYNHILKMEVGGKNGEVNVWSLLKAKQLCKRGVIISCECLGLVSSPFLLQIRKRKMKVNGVCSTRGTC